LPAFCPDYRIEHHGLYVADSAFVLTWTVRATLPDQTPVCSLHCTVVTVKDGLIVRLDDYCDKAQAALLREVVERMLKSRDLASTPEQA
jgi:hypothetical protein